VAGISFGRNRRIKEEKRKRGKEEKNKRINEEKNYTQYFYNTIL